MVWKERLNFEFNFEDECIRTKTLKPTKTDVAFLIMEMKKVTDRVDSLERKVDDDNEKDSITFGAETFVKHAIDEHNNQIIKEMQEMKSSFKSLKTGVYEQIDRLVVSSYSKFGFYIGRFI